MVADPVEHHDHLAGLSGGGDRLLQLSVDRTGPAAVLVGDPVGQHPAAVGGLPPERRRLEITLVRPRAQEGVAVHALPAEDLRQHRVVAERVGIHADRGHPGEPRLQIPLAVETLADEALRAGHVAVGFHPPAAHVHPTPFGHPGGDLGEQLGVGLLDPRQQHDLVAGEHEVGILVHPVERRPERGPRFLVALLPRPQPHRIQVSVADEVDRPIGGRRRPCYGLPRTRKRCARRGVRHRGWVLG